ncbi:MAG: hypothetical protein Fur006_45310 [Coleofasciculaceae cyanobacterium]
MLDIKIFDVDHGFCAAINAGNQHQILIDCGYNSQTRFHPTGYLLNNSTHHLNYLIIPTFAQGCLAGFYDLMGHSRKHCLTIDYLMANPSIDLENLPALIVQNFGKSNSFKFLSDVFKRCSNVERTVHQGNIEVSFFWNTYPEFLDFHNLSLVTFVSYKDINIIFPGNLKTEGWRTLLRNSKFRDRLQQVNLFVASNHGQEDGYCPEVFNYCHPDLIIISNESHRLVPASIMQQYERHARGIETTWGQQKVLTTHEAGTISIKQHPDNSLQVITQQCKVYPTLRQHKCSLELRATTYFSKLAGVAP